jgi:hypothetical protein
MKISHTIITTTLLSGLLTATAFAQQSLNSNAGTAGTAGQNVRNLLGEFGRIVDLSIGILVTLALAAFFWGLVRYIFKLGGKEGSDEGKKIMTYGLVALFVMVSVWGIITFAQNFIGVNDKEELGTGNLVPDARTKGIIR